MGKPDDWMAVNRKDWRDGTAFMTPAARGVYNDLCLEYFGLGPLPNDDEVLRGLGRCNERVWRQVKDQVLAKFREKDGILYHERVDKERADASRRFASKSRAGEVGGKASGEARRKQTRSNRSTDDEADVQARPQANANTLYQVHNYPSDNLGRERPQTKRGTTIPIDWKPNEKDSAHATDRGISQRHLSEIAEHFRDHHIAKGTVSKDWSASWRTWIANHKRFSGGNDAGQRPKGHTYDRPSPTAARDRILAKAGVRPSNGEAPAEIRADGNGGTAGDFGSDQDSGPIIDADEWQRVPGSVDGNEGSDPSISGDNGRPGGPTDGVSETLHGLPIGCGSSRVEDAA